MRVVAVLGAIALLGFAPKWAAIVVLFALVRRRRLIAVDLLVWPVLAGLSLTTALPWLLVQAGQRNVLGTVHPLTIGIWATTLVFAISAVAGAVAAVRWSLRPDRPSLVSRLVPTAVAFAALGFALWLGANGIIGLRTWAW
jgi:hypothetical protein